MISISSYARRRGVAASTVRRWIADLLGIDLEPGEMHELEPGQLRDVDAVERTLGGHYRLRVAKKVA